MKNELKATTQKSYYGKAVVIDGANGVKMLKSYDTIVCSYDPMTGEFARMWGGYSRTTMNHVNDFRRLFDLPALSKKEWESIPCGNDERFRVEFSNGFVNWKAGIVFDDEDEAWDFAESVCASRDYRISADVVSF